METVRPAKIRYIKLGQGGAWEAALDEGRVAWGLPSDPHEQAMAGDWNGVTERYAATAPARGVATGLTNEARAFYDGDETVLWITFARGQMWWAFADATVHWIGGDGASAGTRYRAAIGGWRDVDAGGEQLSAARLSTRLTRLAAYRRTICTLAEDQRVLCLRYINAEQDLEQQAVIDAREKLRGRLLPLIRRLSWSDFEQLVDMMMTRSGWQRVSDLGGLTKDIDLIVQQPLTGDRIAIQVKSSATQQVVNDYAARLAAWGGSERHLLICHSPVGQIAAPTISGRRLEVMLAEDITALAINAGLVDWIIDHAR